jgi:hypothetical protein
VDVRAYYDALIRQALQEWQGETMYLALDTTMIRRRLGICRLSVIYRGRAVPLTWCAYGQRSSTVQFEVYADLMNHARSLLPEGCEVILLVDRGFNMARLIEWCWQAGWHFRIRLRNNMMVLLEDGSYLKLREIRLRPGMVRFFRNVRLSRCGYGPVDLAMAWSKGENTQPWYIATDQRAERQTLGDYALRMQIEASFKDDKSGGFQLEAGRMWDTVTVDRLLLVMALGCLYAASVGTQLVADETREAVDAHRERGLSYFQVGWRFIRQALYHGRPLRFTPRLCPRPDPAPVPTARSKVKLHPMEWLPVGGGP